jgi:hypothetical protein
MIRKADIVERPSLVQSYQEHMVNYLMCSRGCTKEQAEKFVEETVTNNLKSPDMKSVETTSYGNTKVRTISLGLFVNKIRNKIVCPSGSIYKPVYKKLAFLCKMIKNGLAMRKVVKKKKMQALEAGDKIAAEMHDYGQASIKIKLNSLPGGLGSPYNLFYDKGGYNSITSSARALIAHSYTCAEQLLGGNYAWFNEQEGIHHVMVAIAKAPKAEVITSITNRFRLKEISAEKTHEFMAESIRQYQHKDPCGELLTVLKAAPPHVVTFIYYMGNLRNLLWENDHIFKEFVSGLLSYDQNISTEGFEPSDIWNVDEDLLAVALTVMAKEMEGIKISELTKKHPNTAKMIAANGKVMQDKLNTLDDLFNVFIYHDIVTPNILTRKNMFRNTVIISDTDSVIYTSKPWVDWYVGQTDKIVSSSYDIAALATYWLTKVNADVMAKYSIAQGATGDNVPVMQMKNEFLYPALLMYDIKKVYAGVIKVVEGVVLPEAKPDLKGAAIRGSSVAKEARDFCEDLIIEQILKPSMDGQLSAAMLIKHCVDFEHHIRTSIENGETTFLQNQSVKMPAEYSNPDGSAWLYVEAWNRVFGAKHGKIAPPDKVPIMKLVPPTMDYYEDLLKKDKTMHDAWCSFVEEKGKFPTSIVIAPTARKIPEEIIPLCDIRAIIYKNMKPVYLTLERLNISQGFSKKELLLSDVYC